jgi:hypothetical protein
MGLSALGFILRPQQNSSKASRIFWCLIFGEADELKSSPVIYKQNTATLGSNPQHFISSLIDN